MQPIGSDRLRVTGDRRIVLSSRMDKGWSARVGKTPTSPEHPGTAVLCGDEYYEVVESTLQQQGGVRYVLAPWRDEHAIRVADRYDEESEAQRVAGHEAALRRHRYRRGANLLGILVGHLPSGVQEQLGFELGILPARLSLLSLLLPMGVAAAIIVSQVGRLTGVGMPPVSLPMIVVAGFFLGESMIRFLIIFTQSRPAGSAIGVLLYLLAYAVGPRERMFSPFASSRGNAIFTIAPEEERELQDELLMKAPYATLLTPEEQRRLAERFGFDYRKHAYGITWVLLIAGIVGAVSSFGTLRQGGGVSALLALLAAVGLAVEQVIRLLALSRGPAGSVLGFVVRPMMRRLL
ncbi:MAG: hypothetical protein JWO97_3893 [Acidobacteria bacterium]|nr:hypothetical protein [Acidobacteriota bacterium]